MTVSPFTKHLNVIMSFTSTPIVTVRTLPHIASEKLPTAWIADRSTRYRIYNFRFTVRVCYKTSLKDFIFFVDKMMNPTSMETWIMSILHFISNHGDILFCSWVVMFGVGFCGLCCLSPAVLLPFLHPGATCAAQVIRFISFREK